MNLSTARPPRAASRTATGRYLTARLGADHYGLPVTRVREIIRMAEKLTHIPQLPAFVKGCLNLRGTVIPVLDLRGKFHIPPQGDPAHNCIIIAEVSLGAQPLLTGLIVDGVEEVIALKPEDIAPAPEFGGGLDTRFIAGMARGRNELITLLEIDQVFTLETLQALKDGVEAIPVEDAASAA